jgi:hypothetical protein
MLLKDMDNADEELFSADDELHGCRFHRRDSLILSSIICRIYLYSHTISYGTLES